MRSAQVFVENWFFILVEVPGSIIL